MFDIGFSQLLIIAIVALIVLGPERLPKAARFAGLWMRRARAQWHSVRSELERELAAEDLKRSLQDARDAVNEVQGSARQVRDGVKREFDAIQDNVREAADDVSAIGREAKIDAGDSATADDGAKDTAKEDDGHGR